MANVRELTQGSNASATADGFSDTLIYRVSELQPTGDSRIRYEAMLEPGVPQIGERHPYFPSIVVQSVGPVEMEEGGAFSARVPVTYGQPTTETGGGGGGGENDPEGLTVRQGVVYERIDSNYATNIDGTRGDKITLTWDAAQAFLLAGGSSADPIAEELRNVTNTQIGTASNFVQRPTVVVSGRADVIPLEESLRVGNTNSGAWLGGIRQFFNNVPPEMNEPDTWLMIRQSAERQPGRDYATWEREWAFNAQKWYEIVTFIDPETGRPPGNAAAPNQIVPGNRGVGTLVVRIAGQADFSDLVRNG